MLVQRRAILLAIVGATPADNLALKGILDSGFLFTVKSWLDEILNTGIGGVDLLLHLLGSIAMLPVTKDMVTSSKLGKLVAGLDKHKICVGSMNEGAIKERVAKVKEEWSASVKRMKKVSFQQMISSFLVYNNVSPLCSCTDDSFIKQVNAASSSPPSASLKRSLELDATNAAAKKSKPNEQPKKASLSSYLMKVSGGSNMESAAELTRKRAQEQDAQLRARLAVPEQSAPVTIPAYTVENHLHLEAAQLGKLLIHSMDFALHMMYQLDFNSFYS